jgi:predicted O-methyltransferase YrrM
LVKKVNEFKIWLENNENINIKFYSLDDGIAVIKKNK